MRRVQFLRGHSLYNAGEVAGFSDDVAARLTTGPNPPAFYVDRPEETKDDDVTGEPQETPEETPETAGESTNDRPRRRR